MKKKCLSLEEVLSVWNIYDPFISGLLDFANNCFLTPKIKFNLSSLLMLKKFPFFTQVVELFNFLSFTVVETSVKCLEWHWLVKVACSALGFFFIYVWAGLILIFSLITLFIIQFLAVFIENLCWLRFFYLSDCSLLSHLIIDECLTFWLQILFK